MAGIERFDLAGRVALVTGGPGWLGRGMSSALAEQGARACVASRDAEGISNLASQLAGNADALVLDVSDEKATRGCVDKAVALTGSIDILVNNAYEGSGSAWTEASASDFEIALRVGVTAGFTAAQQMATRADRSAAGGSIIQCVQHLWHGSRAIPRTALDSTVRRTITQQRVQ